MLSYLTAVTFNPTTTLLLTTLAAILGMMTLVWLVSLVRTDVSIVDPFWGLGFVLVASVSFFYLGGFEDELPARRLLLLVLPVVWGLRLGGYLLWRNLKENEEDYRYARMRAKRGKSFQWKSLFVIFWFQAVLLWFISFPLQFGQQNAAGIEPGWLALDWLALDWLDWAGIALFAVGLFFETVGDWQLARFKADPANKGQVLDTGLWRYTRHPNYFGDFCVWWGFFLIACGTPGGWQTILSPIVMSLFLLKVSGVSMLEKDIGERRPAYRKYIQKTSTFFPRWPRN